MNPLRKMIKFIIIAGFIWLIDSMFFCLAADIPFLSSLWTGVSTARLLIRLIIILVILMVGFTLVIRREMEYMKVMRMGESDRSALYGSPDSPSKSRRLLYYALRLAILMKMNVREQENLRKLCYCYDLGLVGVPNEFLVSHEDLDSEGQKLWDNHITLGEEIAANIPQLSRIAHLIACHEERYDGSGFQSLYGKSIPLACRILAVVMMYDYFTHHNREGRVMGSQEALNELDMYAGSILDPDVMEAYHSLFADQRLASNITDRVYAR